MTARERVRFVRSRHTLAGWPLLMTLVIGCGGTSPGDVGCVKDVECKGNRVCRQGMCMDPAGPAPLDALTGEGNDAQGLPLATLDGSPAVVTPAADGGVADGGPTLSPAADALLPAPLDTLAPLLDSGSVSGDVAPVGGGAVVKLCNELSKGMIDFTITVLLGPPQNPIRLSALSGTCSPPTGMACTPIPTGDVPYVMLDGTEELDRGVVRGVRAGEEILLLATLNKTTGAPMVEGGPLKPEFKCADLVF
jgi:hypothetical protein